MRKKTEEEKAAAKPIKMYKKIQKLKQVQTKEAMGTQREAEQQQKQNSKLSNSMMKNTI